MSEGGGAEGGVGVYNEGNTAETPNETSTDLRHRGSELGKSIDPLTEADQLSTDEDQDVTLQRKVGLIGGISLIAGTMIGSGIFISPKGVLESTGSIGGSLCVWAGCGIISMIGALCYAELGLIVREAGGEYAYLMRSFGGLQKFFGPIPAFLFAWISVIVLKPSSFAIIALAFADYCTNPFFDNCGPPVFIVKTLTAACIVTVTAINCYSVKLAARVQIFFTCAKILALCIVLIGGFVRLGQGHVGNFQNSFAGTQADASLFALAFYSGLWAYDGWNNLNYVTEEIVKPRRNLPLAIFIAIPLVTSLYVTVNISYFTVMSADELLGSPAVASTWGRSVIPAAAWIMTVSVALSTFGACNGSVFTGGRLCFAAARKGHLLKILSMVHVMRYTPIPSLLFNATLAMLMIIPGDIESLIDFFSFTAWLFYGLTFLSLIVLRFTMKDEPRPLKIPIIIPIIALLIAIYLVVAPIVNQPQIEFLWAFIFVLAGLVFYVPFIYFAIRVPGLDRVTTFFQLFLEVSPTDRMPDE